MTLEGLSQGWNDLRNAVLGRGASPPPNVPAALAARVANAYDRWRTWYTNEGLAASLVSDLRQQGWLAEYRVLVEEARAAGIAVEELPMGTYEAAERNVARNVRDLKTGIKEGLGSVGTTFALMGLVLSVPALIFSMLGSRK